MQNNIFQKMNLLGAAREAFLFVIDYGRTNDSMILSPHEAAANGIFYNINGVTNGSMPSRPGIKNSKFERFPPSFEIYQKGFDVVMKHLRFGNSYLVNLTSRTRIEMSLDLTSVYDDSAAPYRLLCRDEFVCFSPESFVRIDNNQIASFPMKGTIDAGIPDAGMIILQDKKETAEHYTIVDLIRNDLSMVAKNVHVPRFRFIDRIATNRKDLLQVSSEIRGELPADWHCHLGDLMNALLPAGSVTGAPKEKTLEIISEAENYHRGFYTGVFGFFNGQSLDSGVMIRFIQKEDGQFFYKSGGGITVYSDARSEYEEMINKVYVPFA